MVFLLSIFLCALSTIPSDVEKKIQKNGLETLLDQQENFPTTSSSQITPHVNVITGEHVEEECDLIVHGSEPLSLRRFYGHHASYREGYNFWRYNPEHTCVANFEYDEQKLFGAIGLSNGNILCLDNSQQKGFSYSLKPEFMQMGANGKTHPLNVKISYHAENYGKDKKFSWVGEISLGDGTKRLFNSPHFAWLSNIRVLENFRYPELGYYKITPNVWTPYELPVVEERLPNGNIIHYEYEEHPSGRFGYPQYHLLKSITAYNSAKTKILSSLQIQYKKPNRALPCEGMEITGSDGRKAFLDSTRLDRDHAFLMYVATPDKPPLFYQQDKRKSVAEPYRIKGVGRPEGRLITTEYDKRSGRVICQYAPIGPQGEMTPITRYTYHNNSTEVIDAEGNKTIYHFDANKKITHFETYDKNKLYRVEKYVWDANTGNLLSKTLEDGSGKVVRKHEFAYDKNRNAIQESVGDGKESYSTYRTYSDDGFNLLLAEWDDFGKRIENSYVPGTNLMKTCRICDQDKTGLSTEFFYDDCAILIKKVVDDGKILRETMIQPRYHHPCFGLPEIVTEKASGKLASKVVYSYTPFGKVAKEEHYDCTDTFCYAIENTYDERERLVAKTNALGEKTHFTYDLNNNLLSQMGPRDDFQKHWKYDLVNRPVQECEGPHVKTVKYDKLGHVTNSKGITGAETQFQYDALGRLKTTLFADGHKEEKEYDILDNCTKEIDGNGFVTEKTYNFRNQVTTATYPDGGKEAFTYRADGKLIDSLDKNGVKHKFSYDALGNVLSEVINDKKIRTATFSTIYQLSETDPGGVITYFTYDSFGRKASETTDEKVTSFFYDTLGRLKKTVLDDCYTLIEYDVLNRPIKKSTALTEEAYAYDPFGHQTKIITSKGTFETVYNTLGEVIATIDPLGNKTEIAYTYLGGKTQTITQPNGIKKVIKCDLLDRECETSTLNREGRIIQKCTKKYDLAGNLIEEKNGLFEGTAWKKDKVHTWTYGPCHQISSITEEEIKKTSFIYDECGRLKTIIKPDGTKLEHTYDDFSRLQNVTSPHFDYRYTYDLCDQLLIAEERFSNAITKRTYDALGNIVAEQLENGLTLNTRYDQQGRKKQLILPDQSTIDYTYNGEKLQSVARGTHIHTYMKRDKEGCCTLSKLPGQLGTLEITRDKLNRPNKITSPYYTAIYDNSAYDPVGNLLHYTFVDELGVKEAAFTYDDLNQLTHENEHSYQFDSLNNCIKKDNTPYSLNTLCQIENPGYQYDANGNLIEKGGWHFKYDAYDRLIEVKNLNHHITYLYDAFHRRMAQISNGIRENFLWDGENEIGKTSQENTLLELRILGEGLGAEIGSSILIELHGIPYVPLFDHRGSLITLITLTTKTPLAYRYTAFGEEQTTNTLSPWTFSNKRLDPETHLLYFGRRYYDPSLTRWLTPDPAGLTDGPNLYAYVHNNPLTQYDLYGLKDNGLFSWFPRTLRADFNKPTWIKERIGCHHMQTDFEDGFKNRSTTFELGRPNLPGMQVGYANGMNTDFIDNADITEYLSDNLGHINIKGVYNATHGFCEDIRQCALNLFKGKVTPAVQKLQETWTEHYIKRPGEKFLQICTSHAAILVRNGLEHSPECIRNTIIVLAISPGAYIDKRLCLDVVHLRSERDFVPFFDSAGRSRCLDTTQVLKPHPDAPFFDHSITSPTFREPIRDEFFRFYNMYRTTQ